jgi:hypothetical protein
MHAPEPRRLAWIILLDTGGLDPAPLTLQCRRDLGWLADCDEPATAGLIEIVGEVRSAAHNGELSRSQRHTEPTPVPRQGDWSNAR